MNVYTAAKFVLLLEIADKNVKLSVSFVLWIHGINPLTNHE